MKKSLQELEREARKGLREQLALERAQVAAGIPVDTSWTDNLPDDPLPGDEDETSVTFVTRPKPNVR